MKKPNIFIFGDGLVGSMVLEGLREMTEWNIVSYKESSNYRIESNPPVIDISRILDELTEKHGKPDIIINMIGVVGKPNVEWCEDHKRETKYGNTLIPTEMAYKAIKLGVPFIHLSTGCIYDDLENTKRTFKASDTPNFDESYYSFSKLQGENNLKALHQQNPASQIEIHRIRIPFMAESDPRNAINKIINYDTLVEYPNSMTCLEDYVEFVIDRVDAILKHNISKGWLNIFNAVNKDPIPYSEIVEFIKEFAGVKMNPKKYITPKELKVMVKVPRSNCTLAEGKLPDTRTSLLRVLKEYHIAIRI